MFGKDLNFNENFDVVGRCSPLLSTVCTNEEPRQVPGPNQWYRRCRWWYRGVIREYSQIAKDWRVMLTSGKGASSISFPVFFRAEEGLLLLFFSKYISRFLKIRETSGIYILKKNSSKSPSSAPKKQGSS